MKNVFKKGFQYLTDPWQRFRRDEFLGKYDSLSDEAFIKTKWKAFFGKELSLENPTTLCEKIQWLKLHDRKPEYTINAPAPEAASIVTAKRSAGSPKLASIDLSKDSMEPTAPAQEMFRNRIS